MRVTRSAVEDAAFRLNKKERRILATACAAGKLTQDSIRIENIWGHHGTTRRMGSLGVITAQGLPPIWAYWFQEEWTIRPTFFGHQVNRALARMQEAA